MRVKSVDEVSDIVGYSHPTSFPAVFNQYVGVRLRSVGIRRSSNITKLSSARVAPPAQSCDSAS